MVGSKKSSAIKRGEVADNRGIHGNFTLKSDLAESVSRKTGIKQIELSALLTYQRPQRPKPQSKNIPRAPKMLIKDRTSLKSKKTTNSPTTNSQINLPIMPDHTNLTRVDSKTLRDLSKLDLENFLSELQKSIQNNTIHNIINIISDNLELINQELEGDKKDEIVELLTKVACVKNEKEGNTIFHILASHKNLSEKEIKILELFNNLENVMPVAMEVKNKEGKIPLDVAKKNGNNQFILNIKRVRLIKLSAFESDSDPQSTKSSKPNPEQTTPNSGSDADSGINSPGPSEKESEINSAENSKLSINSRRDSLTSAKSISSNGNLSSSTGSLNLILSAAATSSAPTEPKIPPKPASRPSLNKEIPTPKSDSESDSGRGSDEETPIKIKEAEEENYKLEKPKLLIDGNNNNYGNKDTILAKQSNDRNFYIALTTVCTLGAIACFATAGLYFMSAKKIDLAISSIAVIGALCVIGIGFTIAAVTTWCLTPPSSKVESINVNSLANGKQR